MRGIRLVAAFISATLLLTSAPAAAKSGLPNLVEARAKTYIAAALKREDEFAYRYAKGKHIRDCKSLSRTRMRCTVSWYLGDMSFHGHATIWLGRKHGHLYWFYSYDITGENEYCQSVGGKNCIRHWHVK